MRIVSLYFGAMTATDQAKKLLQDAEKSLRELVSSAVARGDYESVVVVTSLAKSVGELIAQVKDDEQASTSARRSSRANNGRNATLSVQSRAKSQITKTTRMGRQKRKKARKRAAGFPRFRRQGTTLVKIGYSKRRGMYTHRASKEGLRIVAEAMARAGEGGKLFTADEIMAETERNSSPEVLSYQVYLCLGWIKYEGLVQSQGRQGYRVTPDTPLVQAVEERWAILPEE